MRSNDSNGGQRIMRINLGPAAKVELKTDEGERRAGWYNQVWRGEYEFIGEAGARAGQKAVLIRGSEKKANKAKGTDWSVGERSTLQSDPTSEYSTAKAGSHASNPKTYEPPPRGLP